MGKPIPRPCDPLSIQQPYPSIEIGGKGDPQQVRDLEPGGQAVHPAESKNHPQDEGPQNQQPAKGKAEALKVEKEDAPAEVEGQLDPQRATDFGTVPERPETDRSAPRPPP